MYLFCSGLATYGQDRGNYSGNMKMSNVNAFKLNPTNN